MNFGHSSPPNTIYWLLYACTIVERKPPGQLREFCTVLQLRRSPELREHRAATDCRIRMLLIAVRLGRFFSSLFSCSLSRTQTRNLVSGFAERKQKASRRARQEAETKDAG
jgi:hypothetical protein